MISELFKSKLDQSEQICQEIIKLSKELDSIAACQDPKLTADYNDDPVTVSHEHAGATLSITSFADNRAIFEPGTSQVGDSFRPPQIQASPIPIQNGLLPSSALNKHPQLRQPSPAEGLSNCTVQTSPHNHTNSSIVSTGGQWPSNEEIHQSTLQDSPHNPERPQSSLTSQCTSSQSSPVHHPPSQPSPAESSPSQSPPPQSTPQTCYSGLQIRYEMQDGVIRLLPTAEQWFDFPTFLQYAQRLDAEEAGISKVVLPEGVVGRSKPLRYTKQKGYSYSALPQSNGTFGIERKERKDAVKKSPKPADVPFGAMAVQTFEELLRKKSGLKDVVYCTDIAVREPKDRESLGLFTSPVWPLEGDRLRETRMRIPGIHWPYAYESYDSFGAPFAMHREDGDLHSINYLYEGDKYWVAVPRSQAELLEQKSKETNGSYYLSDCAQFLRQSATYFPTSILDEWNISYKVVHQKAGEVIITYPQVYHQGFSAGYTFAEAANYADQNWNIQGYRECDSRYCPEGFIRNSVLEFRDEDEEQHSEGSSDNDENHNSLAGETRTQARIDDHSAVKKRKSSPKKPVQSTAAANERGASSNKAAKRKPVGQDTPNKIPKIQRSLTNDASAFFSSLTPIPKNMKQPTNIYQIFTDRSESGNSDTIWLLTRLFFAIGSPDAFCQLRDACGASRQVKEHVILQSTKSISEAMQALDRLDITAITASILRRFYLTFLVTQRDEQESYHQSQRPKRVSRTQNFSYTNSDHDGRTATEQDCLRRADTIALTRLMANAYPSLKPTRKCNTATDDEYQKKLSSLKVRLRDGRNWHKMQQRLSPGILALVPTRGDYQIQNRELVSSPTSFVNFLIQNRVERLSTPQFSLFLEILIEFRGDFLRKVSGLVSQHICEILYRKDLNRRYVFETLDGDDLKQEHLDSENLMKFCELES